MEYKTTIKIWKLVFVLLTVFLFGYSGHAQTLGSLYDIQQRSGDQLYIEKGTELKRALEKVEEYYNVGLLYKSSIVVDVKIQSGSRFSTDIEEALSILLSNTNLEFKYLNPKTYGIFENEEITPKKVEKVLQQNITGTVTDAGTGEAVPGVNVIVVGSQQATGSIIGTTTNIDGQYELEVPDDLNMIAFTYVGYLRTEIEINGRNTIDVELSQDITGLEELVVVGYGQQRREDITGAISSVSGDDIKSIQVSGVQEALQGRVAGVNVTPSTGQPGAPLDINIRGLSTFGNGNPLFVIDGVPVFSGSGGTNNSLATLNPENIASIEILKDASASAIYGARAANGVVLITTERGQAGQTQFSVGVSRGVSTVQSEMDMMNSQQYVDYAIEGHQNAGMELPISLEEPLVSENLQTNTNWPEAVFSPCLLYTSPSPRDQRGSRMPSSA